MHEKTATSSIDEPASWEVPVRSADADPDLLFRHRYLPLVRLANKMLGSVEDAEDVVQDVFARLQTLDLEGVQSTDAYLTSMVMNGCRTQSRRMRLRRDHSRGRPPSSPQSDTTVEDADMIRQAVTRLPLRQRQVIVLRFYQDLSIAETASVLGIAQSAVKSATVKGLDNLQKELGHDRSR